jgi:predicted small lipoprotein YifL
MRANILALLIISISGCGNDSDDYVEQISMLITLKLNVMGLISLHACGLDQALKRNG